MSATALWRAAAAASARRLGALPPPLLLLLPPPPLLLLLLLLGRGPGSDAAGVLTVTRTSCIAVD
jgi:hypothetical protein